MKKILALAAVAALTAGVSAFAANPFSDVTPDDWAYQAISDLSDQGVVEGYPDGTFKGERNMTRYELAQIIARLMAREDQLNAEQRATLDKLAGEYSDELANLGVRVGNLEKKVGNIYWSGDARMRYYNQSAQGPDVWDGRIRINARGQVNDSTYVQGQFTSNMNFKNGADATTAASQLYVNHYLSKEVQVRLGRQPIVFGNQDGWLYGSYKGYDGGQVSYNNGKLSLTTGYGQFNASNGDFASPSSNPKRGASKAGVADGDDNTADFFFAKGSYDFNFAKLGVDYIAFQDRHDVTNNKALDGSKPEIIGANLLIPFGGNQKFGVNGEYWKNTTAKTGDDTAWNAGLVYGKANWNKPGSFDFGIWYNQVDSGMYFGGSGSQDGSFYNNFVTDKKGYATSLKFWNILTNITIQKNIQLKLTYTFAGDADNADDPQDAWGASLNYKF